MNKYFPATTISFLLTKQNKMAFHADRWCSNRISRSLEAWELKISGQAFVAFCFICSLLNFKGLYHYGKYITNLWQIIKSKWLY